MILGNNEIIQTDAINYNLRKINLMIPARRCSTGGGSWFDFLSNTKRLPKFSRRRLQTFLLPWICTLTYGAQPEAPL